MGKVIGIMGHPRFKTAADRKLDAFLEEWVRVVSTPPPPKEDIPRLEAIGKDIQENVTFTYDWSGLGLTDSQRIKLAETTEELQTIADELGVDLNDKE